jgi:3-dehydrosphinganine reductase
MLDCLFDFSCPLCCASWAAVVFFLALVVISTLRTPTFDYNNKHVLVTGGSSGIGLEVAREYLRLGANVTIMARDAGRLEIAKKDLEKALSSKQKVLIVSLDTSKGQEAVDKSLQPAIKELGDVDVLVNCAGVSIAGEFNELDVAEFERMLRINVLGEFS